MLGSVLNRLDHLVDIKFKATHGLGSLRDWDEFPHPAHKQRVVRLE